jgi:opacity protein-like surface antigen
MLRRFGFLLAAALIVAAPAAAQDERPVQLNIGGGWTGVYGAAADHVGTFGNFTIGVIGKITPVVSIGAEYGWNGMKKKNIQIPVSATPTGSSVPTDFFADGNMQYGDFNVLLHPPTTGKAAPYFITGLGVYYRPITITTPSVGFATVCDPYWYVCYPTAVAVDQIVGERSSTDFGMNFGGGVNVKLGENSSLYFEVRYHYVWGPTVSNPASSTATTTKANGQFVPITIGFRF